MKKERFTESTALQLLDKKRDVRVEGRLISQRPVAIRNTEGELVDNPKSKLDTGIKTLGAIDYLVNVQGYSKIFQDF